MVVVAAGAAPWSMAEAQALQGTEPQIAVAEVSLAGSSDQVRILARQYMRQSLSEIDVIFERGAVVSFVSAIGAGQRARCEAVYLRDDAWFAFCDVFDLTFASLAELTKALPSCVGCSPSRRYGVGAHSVLCGPVFLGNGAVGGADRRPPATMDLALTAATELASWKDNDIRALRTAMRLVGQYGCPTLNRPVAQALGVDPQPLFETRRSHSPEEIPDEIAAALDYERARSLAAWLDQTVARLP